MSRTPEGDFVVVGQRNSGGFGASGIFARRFDADGDPVGTEIRVNEGDRVTDSAGVAHDADGGFVVVWNGAESVGTDYHIFGRRYDSDGNALGTEFQISNATPAYFTLPDVASLGDGEFVVVWRARDMPGDYIYDVFGQRLQSDGAKLGTEFQANTTEPGYESSEVRVASAGDGRFVVIWDGYDGSSTGVFGQRFATSGAATGTQFLVNTFTTYPENEATVAMHSDASFVVAWKTVYGDEEPGGPFGTIDTHSITMRRYSAAGLPLGDEVHINSVIAGNQGEPHIAMDDDGTFVVVWTTYSPYNSYDARVGADGNGTVGQCFEANGTPIGNEFQINGSPQDGNYQGAKSFATDGSGNFVVVWNEQESRYGAGAIKARRYRLSSLGPTTTTTTLPQPGLDIEKTDNDHAWGEDPVIPYEITVTAVAEPLTDVVVTETVPEKTTFEPASSTPGWTCTPDNNAGSTCTFDVGQLAANDSDVITFAVRVDDDTADSWEVYNEVAGSANNAESLGVGDHQEGGCQGIICIVIAIITGYLDPEDVCLPDEPLGCIGACVYCFIADILNPNPSVCGVNTFPALATATTGPESVDKAFQTITSLRLPLYRLRDRVFQQTRGGQRAVELYYEHSPAMGMAAATNQNVLDLAVAALEAWDPSLMALSEGNGDSVITQGQVDALNAFLDALRAAADGDLAAAIDRERPRLDIDSWAGMTMDETFAEFEALTCDGFEDILFCGELTGDCRVTPTDALRILRIFVSLDPFDQAADVDGNGTVAPTDALIALRIAVSLEQQRNDCNL